MLSLISKTPVKFQWTDDIAKTEVVLQPDDPSEVLVAKLQRVLELEGAALPALPVRAPGASLAPQAPTFTPADRAATDERLKGAQAMGWNASVEDGIDNLPEFS